MRKAPEDVIRNIIANIAGDEIEWNRRGQYIK
jgi:hypothetical protein